jgi:hypothetical protein
MTDKVVHGVRGSPAQIVVAVAEGITLHLLHRGSSRDIVLLLDFSSFETGKMETISYSL